MSRSDQKLTAHHRRELGSTGIMVSPLGFGASPLGNEFGTIDVSEEQKNAASSPGDRSLPLHASFHAVAVSNCLPDGCLTFPSQELTLN
jgi:hypothetical protein